MLLSFILVEPCLGINFSVRLGTKQVYFLESDETGTIDTRKLKNIYKFKYEENLVSLWVTNENYEILIPAIEQWATEDSIDMEKSLLLQISPFH